ncbi:carbohydrate ABC transporter permease [Dactylosporangium siamense]|uniref:Sugar ABC transporter permease n=1 Tax=Dactylosporangium siamense TaxID=685454 RepID=A0A919UDW5_9ACTN|nr:carbohydrate ABC transporter permease [Dactylosporangium siamense]GIG47053.1 sugar ABC transporter permease [Dactylosporangium siamense]
MTVAIRPAPSGNVRRRQSAAADTPLARFGRAVGVVGLVLCAAATALPLVLLIFNALKGSGEVLADPIGPPVPPHFGNLTDAWSQGPSGAPLAQNFLNSVIVTSGTVALVTVLAAFAGYALGGFSFPGEKWVTQGILILLAVPVQATLIPVFDMLDGAGLRNTYTGIILVYGAFWMPFSVLLLRAAFRAFPRALLEAARVDGAGELRIFFQVVLPVLRGPIAGVAIVNAIGIWSELLFSYVLLTDPSKQTLPAAIIAYQGVFITDYRLLYAGLLISVAPVLIFYAFMSRIIRKGMSAGSFR